MTVEQARAAWIEEWRQATAHAELPVVVFPWHDYGPTGREPGYAEAMYAGLIQTAHAAGAEFVTLADLAQRIAAFEKAGLSYTAAGGTITATVGPAGLGAFALDLEGATAAGPAAGQKIASVTGWYAYDEDSVFRPEAGGTFAINLGAVPADVTHITALPARARLLALAGDGIALDFSVLGEGKVVIDLANSAGSQVVVTGAQVVGQVGDRLELALGALGRHDVSIRAAFADDGDPLFDAPFYLAMNPDVAAAGVDPLRHYHQFGWKKGRDPNALFDTTAWASAPTTPA
jgi:hypothetical protein